MNKIRQSLPWLQFMVAFVVFIAVLGLAILYQDQLKEVVLVPMLYVLWAGELVFKSFDQQCIWLLALVIALVLSLSFSGRTKEPVEDHRMSRTHHFLAAGRIRFWRGQIRVGSSAVYASGYRRSELRRLVIKTLAYREGVSSEEIKEQLRSGGLSVPPEVSYILGLDDTRDSPDQPVALMKRIEEWFDQTIVRFRASAFSPDPRLEKVAEYLESFMEVDNDAENR